MYENMIITVVVRYYRRVLVYSLRYSPSTRVANYSDRTALFHSVNNISVFQLTDVYKYSNSVVSTVKGNNGNGKKGNGKKATEKTATEKTATGKMGNGK